jgi:phage gp29-like protein
MADKPIKSQIVTIQTDPLPYWYGGVMINTDETLITRGGGQPYGLAIYDQIERDCHAAAVLNKRKMAVVSKEWEVLPASPSRKDEKARDIVHEQLKNLNFDRVCLNLLDATLKGFSVGEVMWETDGAEVVAKSVTPLPQRRFWMDLAGKPRLLMIQNVWPGEELPDRKIIVHRFGAKQHEQPYGLGLGYALFWPTFFKRQDITFWLRFLDKYGDPTTIGKYPPGTGIQDQDDLMAALRAIGTDGRIIVPDNVMVELLEATRASSVDSYEKLARYMDEQISECVLGETLTTNLRGGGSLAAAAVHDEVRMEICKADADLLSDTLNDTLVAWITVFNVPGANPPKIWRDCEDPEDLKMRSDRDVNIYDMGFEPDETYINETYGTGVGKWTKRDTSQEAAAPKAPRTTPSNYGELEAGSGKRRAVRRSMLPHHSNTCPHCHTSFAGESRDHHPSLIIHHSEDTPDRIAEPTSAAAGPMTDRMMDPVRKLVFSARSLDEIRDGLLDLYGEMDPRDLGALMAQAMMLADVEGRYEVLRGE